ncbi:MAG: pilus assembly protein PilL, partial [Candidatus Eremiobacteraeota bacterium]|nr:pilus assembly protein PilL [Candidatus Eremiobacteraeota bacterium]
MVPHPKTARAARTAVAIASALMLGACAGAGAASTSSAPAAAPAGPPNALVTDAGRPGAVPLDDAQRRTLNG